VDLLIARSDLHSCRFDDAPAPEPHEGQALLEIQAFGLSANNITYAMFGEAMSYWDFFPAEPGFGRLPVWGFAQVVRSRHAELAEGTRVYGYLPASTHLLVTPARVQAHGFIDAAQHRAALPGAYNAYIDVRADASYQREHEDEQMLLRPLFFTSFLLDDFLADSGLLDVQAVVVSSASSKTASALAFLLALRGDAEVIGLTSQRSAQFVRSLETYDRVVTYEQAGSLAVEPAVYVDIAGDASVREAVHRRYAAKLKHSAVVGATHHDSMGEVPDSLPGPRPAFFFAPDRVAKRTRDWGREGLEERVAEAWHPYVEWTGRWLQVRHGRGPQALQSAYLELLDGSIDPAQAHVLTLAQ
jgi:NADPH:quinone reductase-like Zn-dependent oxidoreductase